MKRDWPVLDRSLHRSVGCLMTLDERARSSRRRATRSTRARRAPTEQPPARLPSTSIPLGLPAPPRLVAGLCLLLVATTWSIVGALHAPGDDDASVKLAEWARDHWLGPVVTAAEAVQYRLNPPQTGGAPDTSQLATGAAENTNASKKVGARSGCRRSFRCQARLVDAR